MSKKAVTVVIGKAVVDSRYRQLLKINPQGALDGYELTGEERHAIAGLDHRELEKLAESLDRRLREWYVNWALEA